MRSEYSAAYPGLYTSHWWWRVREKILLKTISGLLSNHHGAAKILDVGCGAGLFFDALSGYGDVHGVESDVSAVERSGRWRDRILVDELDDRFTRETPFDLILMLDVLEHVRDPQNLLRCAVDILAPGGRVLITVPAFRWLWTANDDMNEHITRYTAQEIQHVVHQAGLAVTSVSYLFQSLVMPKLAVRASEALMRRKARLPRVPAPALNSILQKWFRTERRCRVAALWHFADRRRRQA